MATIHIWQDDATGEVSISAFHVDAPEYESNHVMLAELRNGQVNKHSSVLNIVRNVLTHAGVTVEFD